MNRIPTHYDNLKVARNAPPEVIRAAYKSLSQMYHPDRNPGDAQATRVMAIINSSYDVLSNPDRRREHDKWISRQ
jgi:curved DNA-binding protein CbpA